MNRDEIENIILEECFGWLPSHAQSVAALEYTRPRGQFTIKQINQARVDVEDTRRLIVRLERLGYLKFP
jgi:hypothetical protein